jgi:formylglycine-generating enzyme required for sulfatase activity
VAIYEESKSYNLFLHIPKSVWEEAMEQRKKILLVTLFFAVAFCIFVFAQDENPGRKKNPKEQQKNSTPKKKTLPIFFTLIIQGAPPNSRVFIDNKERCTTTAIRGTYTCKDLRAGEVRTIRVTCRGFADFNGTVIGKNGEEKYYPVTLWVNTNTNVRPLPSPRPSATPTPVPSPRPTQFGMEFVRIQAGSFMMGSNNGDSDEKPVHRVTISNGFEMGKYEVTQLQWRAIMGNNPSYFKGCNSCPVEQVSWDDVQEFINKLNAKNDGYEYRLPTEAEWEYACRAGTTGGYAGNLDSMAWYDSNSGDKTHPVGTKQPNAWGLYDMHGNVWEWCQDWYGAYPSNAVTDPAGARSGSYRVIRGGGWGSGAQDCRAADRYGYAPDVRNGDLGFRLIRTPL